MDEWMNGGMIVKGETRSTWGKLPGPVPRFPPPTSPGIKLMPPQRETDNEPPEPWRGPDFNVEFKQFNNSSQNPLMPP
jgi:hypothetical protein